MQKPSYLPIENRQEFEGQEGESGLALALEVRESTPSKPPCGRQPFWYFPPLKLYIPNLFSSAAQFDFGLGQLPPLPGPRCLLNPLPLQSHGSCQEGSGGLLRRRTLRCPESSTEGPLGPPDPALADFSSLPSDISSYSSLPGIHLGPPDLFSHPHKRSTHLIYFLKGSF